MYQIGGKQEAINTLGEILFNDNQYVVLHALNVIQELGNDVISALNNEIEIVNNNFNDNYYIVRTINYMRNQ